MAAALCLPVALVLMLAGNGSWLSIPFIAGVIGFTLLASAHVPIKVTRRRQTRLKPAREELRQIAATVYLVIPLAGRALAGTLDYAAPEQLGKRPGESAGPAADVYGFGKTCCLALFGTPQPGRKHGQMIPESMAGLLDDCLRDDPAERPAQFDEVIRRLETCAA